MRHAPVLILWTIHECLVKLVWGFWFSLVLWLCDINGKIQHVGTFRYTIYNVEYYCPDKPFVISSQNCLRWSLDNRLPPCYHQIYCPRMVHGIMIWGLCYGIYLVECIGNQIINMAVKRPFLKCVTAFMTAISHMPLVISSRDHHRPSPLSLQLCLNDIYDRQISKLTTISIYQFI